MPGRAGRRNRIQLTIAIMDIRDELRRHKKEISLLSLDLPDEEYAELMRDLASWAESEAERVEFEKELREWEND